MSSDQPPAADLVPGLNQSRKLIKAGNAKEVYLANDAESHIINTVTGLCNEYSIPLDSTMTIVEIGRLCGLDVGCAVCTRKK